MANSVNDWSDYPPLQASLFGCPAQALGYLDEISDSGAPTDLLAGLWRSLAEQLTLIDDPDAALGLLARFIEVSRSPTSLLALFERDSQALPSLLQVLSTGNSIAELLISDPESFDLIRASDGRSASIEILVDELTGELQSMSSVPRAAVAIRRYAGREMLRIAYGEFVRSLPPDRVQRQISQLNDAIMTVALQFVVEQVSAVLNVPQRIDGSQPKYAIIALGNYGGEEIGYGAPLDLLLLCDQIDRRNESHQTFNRAVAAGLIELLASDQGPVVSMNLRFVLQPGEESASSDTQRMNDLDHPDEPLARQIDFHDAMEAAAHYERENQTWQRLAFVKARVAAGDRDLGVRFLHRIEPWVYHRLLTRGEIADIRVLRRKLEKRAMAQHSQHATPIADNPGGRRDIELTIQFLQLLHGGELPDVRLTGTLDAIAALSRHGCLTQQEASILAENHSRLCRLEHHLAVLFDHQVTHLPEDLSLRNRLAWRLGVRTESENEKGWKISRGDAARFEELLAETFDVNRKIINHLTVQDVAPKSDWKPDSAAGSASDSSESRSISELDSVAIETELILDPDPDMNVFRDVLKGHGFENVDLAIDQLSALSHETVSFLSPRRCRHFFAAVAPGLLREISTTPAPDDTLSHLVAVTDSIGAKATLWELIGTNDATLSLMIKLCSLAPYLTEILTRNPGMIDELIDSLVMDRLPTAERLDTQTIRLCQFASDVRPILQTFKAGSHLMIGVRDLLNKETFESIGESLSDTAEACVRRMIETEQEKLANRFGDPMDADGNLVEMVALALGKFGGREPNYHSDLDLTFVYLAEGETRRRVGGPRTTLSNRQFFNQLAQNVIRQMSGDGERLYELDLPLARGDDETVFTFSLAQFAKPFRFGSAPFWQRVSLCQARPFSGSREAQATLRKTIHQAIIQTPWRDSHFNEMKTLRHRGESTATPGNLKRGVGGTVDVQCIVAAGILRSSNQDRLITSTGIVNALQELAAANVYQRSDTETLIQNYRYLRNVEAKLRLINTVARHELPLSSEGGVDTLEMKQLARLLNEPDAQLIVDKCDAARTSNRELFERLLAP